MTSNSIEEAFQRLPRPQVPTKAALLERSLKKTKPPTSSVSSNPWKTLSHQGDLTQGKRTLSLCLQGGSMVMVKKVDHDTGQKELEKVKKISDHPNVTTIKQVFESHNSLLFQYEYTRFTLEEVLNVHMFLKETHIRVIASAVSH
jgi:serine/threonine protein kinase